MADSKITALTALTAADPINDMFPVVDVSDTSMAASGTTKRISVNNILSSSPTASGALTVTGLVTAGSATITGDLTVDTSTLKVDSVNNRVGIVNASPTRALDVVGSAIVSSEIRCSTFDTGTTSGDLYLFTSNRLSQTAAPTIECQNSSKPLIINHTGSQSMLFGIGSSLQMTLNSTGLGVGNSSPAAALDLTNTGVTAFREIRIENSAVRTFLGVEGSSGRFVGSAANNAYFGCSGAFGLEFATNNNVRMVVDSSGNVGIGVTPSAGKGCLQLSSGINFPATQVASSDANTLDDYEEGTWTPSVGGTATYTTQTGRYVKIGNRVFITLRMTINTIGTGDDYRISGLPFQPAAVLAAASVGFFTNLKISANFISGYASTASSVITMTGTTAASANVTNGIGVFGNGSDIVMSCFYEV